MRKDILGYLAAFVIGMLAMGIIVVVAGNVTHNSSRANETCTHSEETGITECSLNDEYGNPISAPDRDFNPNPMPERQSRPPTDGGTGGGDSDSDFGGFNDSENWLQ